MQTITSLEWLGLTADLIGILGAVFALFAWRQARQIREAQMQESSRLNKMVQVVLHHGDQKIELPIQLRRAELTRAEILGRIGMVPMEKRGQRFALAYLNSPEFLKQINQIVDGTGDSVLTIPCTNDEFRQFDL